MSFAPFFLAAIAFLLLGLATDAHHRRRFGYCPGAARRRALRIAAWGALGVGFAAAVLAQGWIFGPILWTGAIMGGAALAFMMLNLIQSRADTQTSRPSI